MNKFLKVFYIFIFFLNLSVCPAYASYRNAGIKLIKEGEKDLAINKFIKALLLDPSDKTAKTYLRRITKILGNKNNRQELSLARFIELSDFHHFLRLQIKNLNEKNIRLLNFLLKSKKSDKTIAKKVQSIQSEVKSMSGKLQTAHEILNPEQLPANPDIKKLNKALQKKKEELLRQLVYHRRVNTQLRPLKIQVIKNMSAIKKKNSSAPLDKQIAKIQTQLKRKDQSFKAQEGNFGRLKKELETLQHNFAAVQEKFIATDKRLAELTGQLAKMSLEVYEKDKLLGIKEERSKQLTDNLKDAEQRLSLVGRIIQEKDAHIRVLVKKINVLQDVVLPEKEINFKQEKKHLSEKVVPFAPQTETNLARIQSLEKQFQAMNEKYLQMEIKMKEKDGTISELKETVSEKNKKLFIIRRVSLFKNRKMAELDGIVQIYKERLKDTYFALSAKKERLRKLEEQLFQTENQLDNSLDERLETRLPKGRNGFISIDSLSRKKILDRTKRDVTILQEIFSRKDHLKN